MGFIRSFSAPRALGRGLALLALVAAAFLGRPVPARADTIVPCADITSPTTWSLAGSPYILTCTIRVRDTAVLTIDPGVVVKAYAGAQLRIGYPNGSTPGAIHANGTQAQPILFTSNSGAVDWAGLVFGNGSASTTSNLTHCTIEKVGSDGGLGLIACLACYSTNQPTVQNCTFQSSVHSGVRLENASPAMDHATFQNNGEADIALYDASSPTLTNCTFAVGTHYAIDGDFSNTLPTLNSCAITGSGFSGYLARLFPESIDATSFDLSGAAPGAGISVVGRNVAVSRTWANLGSGRAYRLEGNVGVIGGATLTLQPGVTIKGNAAVQLRVGWPNAGNVGTLHANGTAALPILFTSNSGAIDWGGLAFGPGSAGSDASYAVVEKVGSDGGLGYAAAVHCVNASPHLDHLRIRNNAALGIYARSVSTPTVTHSEFIGNTLGALSNADATNIPATQNYWSDAGGPYDASPAGDYNNNPAGQAVSDFVVYRPWLTAPPCFDPVTITAGAGAHGSITPAGAVVVPCGIDMTFTITPDDCYHVADVLVDGHSIGAQSSHTFPNVQANASISASFAPNDFTLSASAGPNGSISPAGNSSVSCGGGLTYTITPDSCYAVADVVVDGVSKGAVTSYPFADVVANHTIAVSFTPLTLTVTPSADAGGTITPSSPLAVVCGDTLTFAIHPDAGYRIVDVVTDGVSRGPVESYTFANVQADHTISASFASETFTITPWAGPGGTISPADPVVVNRGADVTFTVTPTDCNRISEVSTDNRYRQPLGNYTFHNVTQNHSIAAYFTGASTAPPQLEAWWTWDDMEGAEVVDIAHLASGQHHGTLVGGASLAPGYVGQALSCQNAGDGMVVSPSATSMYFGASGYLIDGWIYLYPGSPASDRRVIFSKQGEHGFEFCVRAGVPEFWWMEQGIGHFVSSKLVNPLSTGAWHHVAVAADRNDGALRFYVDGLELPGTGSVPNTWESPLQPMAVSVGARTMDGQTAPAFNGLIDELDLSMGSPPFNRRTIQAIYTAGCAGKQRVLARLPLTMHYASAPTVCAKFANFSSAIQPVTWSINPPGRFNPSTGGFVLSPEEVKQQSLTMLSSGPFTLVFGTAGTPSQASVFDGVIQGDPSIYATTSNLCGVEQRPGRGPSGEPLAHLTTSSFMLHNDGPTAVNLACRFEAVTDTSGTPSLNVSVEGLPPGTPYETSVTIAAGDSTLVEVDANVLVDDPFSTMDLRLSADVNGDNVYVPLASVPLGGSGESSMPDNPVFAVSPGVFISTVHPCVTVPVEIERSDDTPIRGFSIDVELSSNLMLCSGTTSIVEGSYLSGSSNRSFHVVDHGGGQYTVDGVILGSPCGATATSGTLFTLDVNNAAGDGTGTIALTGVRLRDCANVPVSSTPGLPAPVQIDLTPPAALSPLTATQVLSGNGSGGTTGITINFSAPSDAALVEIYRAPFGTGSGISSYPEYDDIAGASAPALPSTYPPSAPWTLTTVDADGDVDSGFARGFWSYIGYVKDEAGNVSPRAVAPVGRLNYHLGDTSDGAVLCSGDNHVNVADITHLGANYGAILSSGDSRACLDVGPTTDFSVNGRPTTDNHVDFEDAMMFAINYEQVSVNGGGGSREAGTNASASTDHASSAAPSLVLAFDAVSPGPASSPIVTARLRLEGDGSLVKGIHVGLSFDPARLELVRVNGGSLAGDGSVFLKTVAEDKGLALDAAVLGAGRTFAGPGEVAILEFRQRGASTRPLLSVSQMRDRDNRPVGEASAGSPPSTPGGDTGGRFRDLAEGTLLVQPNPFASHTELVFRLSEPAPVALRVFDTSGRLVRTLAVETMQPGVHELTWDGRSDQGTVAGAGIYFGELRVGERSATEKLLLLQ